MKGRWSWVIKGCPRGGQELIRPRERQWFLHLLICFGILPRVEVYRPGYMDLQTILQTILDKWLKKNLYRNCVIKRILPRQQANNKKKARLTLSPLLVTGQIGNIVRFTKWQSS